MQLHQPNSGIRDIAAVSHPKSCSAFAEMNALRIELALV